MINKSTLSRMLIITVTTLIALAAAITAIFFVLSSTRETSTDKIFNTTQDVRIDTSVDASDLPKKTFVVVSNFVSIDSGVLYRQAEEFTWQDSSTIDAVDANTFIGNANPKITKSATSPILRAQGSNLYRYTYFPTYLPTVPHYVYLSRERYFYRYSGTEQWSQIFDYINVSIGSTIEICKTTGSYSTVDNVVDGNVVGKDYTYTVNRVENTYSIKVDEGVVLVTDATVSRTSVSARFNYGTATVKHNNGTATPYTSGTVLNQEGRYIITLSGTVSATPYTDEKTLYIDTIAPTFSTSGDTTSSVYATWGKNEYETEVTATSAYNGNTAQSYTSGLRLTAVGRYVITATDEAGNSASVTLYVDKTAPTLTPSANSKTSVNVTWSVGTYDSPITATYRLNGNAAVPYTSGAQLTAEGRYIITATDGARNTATVTLYVDRTAPSLSPSADSKTSVRATWNAETYGTAVTATYSLNGNAAVPYTSGAQLTDEGRYIITATDGVGNRASVTLYVDKTAPSLSPSANSKTSVRATWSVGANDSPITATYRHNGNAAVPYTSGAQLTAEGRYIITATDSAGNTATETLYVDRTAPSLSPSTDSKTSVRATWNAETYGTAVTATYSLNGNAAQSYTSGAQLTAEGRYIITATDGVGNSASVTLYVDRTAPTLTPSANSKTSVNVTWSVGMYETAVTATYVHNGEKAAAYTSGTQLTAEGRYIITATDSVGNSASVTLYVDRTAPTLTPSADSKTSVKATWSVGTYDSAVTATYVYNGENAAAYTSGAQLTAEGRYIITATDSVGNTDMVTLYVDKTAPLLTRTAQYSQDSAAVTFTQGIYDSPITATIRLQNASEDRAFAYASGQAMTTEGKYTVTATDSAGNSATIDFVVDRTKPAITCNAQITSSNSAATFKAQDYESPLTATVNDGTSTSAYASGQSLTIEGRYTVTVTDGAGNESVLTVIIDRTAPDVTFYANGASFTKFTRLPFTATTSDSLSGIDNLELFDGSVWRPYDYTPHSANGSYIFRASDNAGNLTTATAVVYNVATFDTADKIFNSYKINEWYTVTLPARIFTTANKDIAGRYSFTTHEQALAFAIEKEREFRVTTVQGGYMYVSATNETLPQKYTDETELSRSVNLYASKYVSSRIVASDSGRDYYYNEPQTLTRNTPALADFLSDYKALPRYRVKLSQTWAKQDVAYIADMKHYVTALYLGDTDYAESTAVTFEDGTLRTALGGNFRQGWYLITESDEAGNRQQYLVYTDTELPSLTATATRGDGQSEVTIDYNYTRNETMYFLSLSLKSLLDNDDYITLKLTYGNRVNYFTQSDALPTLGADGYGSGEYVITVYDRSLNALSFSVFIAASAPTWRHSSLDATNDTCTVTFTTSDRFNVITKVSIVKVEYDGTRTVLETDDEGKTITATTLSYTFSRGGKYGATVCDNYGRTVVLNDIFFLKGLPYGTLTGVRDGGRTNQNVAFAFSNSYTAVIYTLQADGRTVFSDYTAQVGSAQTIYTFAANDTTSHEYLIFLYNTSDMTLFVEYTFEIDTILPEFVITDTDGATITLDGATNKGFSLAWNDPTLTIRYYTQRSGALATTRYSLGTTLTDGTLYYFTAKDDVGNERQFTVLLDNAVDYTVSGVTTTVEGVMYSNTSVTLTINEPTQVFDVENENGYNVANGGEITQEGRYTITVTDNYRNTVVIVIVIDLTPPTLTLDGVSDGESTSGSVTVTAANYDTLALVTERGSLIRYIESPTVFVLGDRYYIQASDYSGNVVTVRFIIDLDVDYTLSVPNGAVTTGKVTLTSTEALDITATLDGEAIEQTTSFAANGTYSLTLTDALGNVEYVTFVILPARLQSLSLSLPSATVAVAATKDGANYTLDGNGLTLTESGRYVITLNCNGKTVELKLTIDNMPPVIELQKEKHTYTLVAVDKNDYTITLTRDGEVISYRKGQQIKDVGKYVLIVTDDLGNTYSEEFTIPYILNSWAIAAIVVGVIIAIVVVIIIIRARKRPRIN